jgi:hypothetical protein
VAAERLGREWITIDRSLIASSITLARVRQEVKNLGAIRLEGFPQDVPTARRLLRQEPVAFGLWGTSMLAAILDSGGSNESVATGAGKLSGRSRSFEVLSWVPLRARVEMTVPLSRHRRLSKVGFLLRHAEGHASLVKRVTRDLNVPVHEVDLDSLVDPRSLKQGVAPKVAAVAAPRH